MLHVRIGVLKSEVIGNFPRHQLDKRFSFPVPNAFWIKRAKKLPYWDGKHHCVRVLPDRIVFQTDVRAYRRTMSQVSIFANVQNRQIVQPGVRINDK